MTRVWLYSIKHYFLSDLHSCFADHWLAVMTRNIVELDSIPVDIVEDSQASLPTIWLRSSSASERPGVLTLGNTFSLSIGPGEGAGVTRHLARGPEVRRSVCGNKAQEVFSFFLVIQRDQLHTF